MYSGVLDSEVSWKKLDKEKEYSYPAKGQGKFVPSQKVLELRNKLLKFMENHIYPMENEFYKLAQSNARWTVHPEEEKLKELAKREGLWNLWIPVCILSIYSLFSFIFVGLLYMEQILLVLIYCFLFY